MPHEQMFHVAFPVLGQVVNVGLNHEIFIKGFSRTDFDAIILNTFLMSCFLKQAFHNH